MGVGLRLLPKLSPIVNEIDYENKSDCGKSMESESETENTMRSHISKRSCGFICLSLQIALFKNICQYCYISYLLSLYIYHRYINIMNRSQIHLVWAAVGSRFKSDWQKASND